MAFMRRTSPTYGATPRADVESDDTGARSPTPKRDRFDSSTLRRRPFAAIAAIAVACVSIMCARHGVTDTIGVISRALGAGTREITFVVHTCGVPQAKWDKHVPWPVCRVKLVGCPGGGRTCYHWRYSEGIEMQPTSSSRNKFTVTTSAYGTGDVYGFAVIEAGCNAVHEAECVGNACKKDEFCDHRYDSGTVSATNMKSKTTNVTCWEGDRCTSKSPFVHPIRWHRPGGHECFTLMGQWWNRVVPARSSKLEYVWGTCMHAPENPDLCVDAEAPNVCTMLEETKPEVINAVEGICGNGLSVDGTACRITHKVPGYESYGVEGSCCGGSCCAAGKLCNRETRTCEDKKTTIESNEGMCSDPENLGLSGVCTQSCGSGNGDCDLTCAAAAEVPGFELTCAPGDPENKCRCSNVGGHTANECKTSENPGWKCCTCKSIVRVKTKENNGNDEYHENNGNNEYHENNGKGRGSNSELQYEV